MEWLASRNKPHLQAIIDGDGKVKRDRGRKMEEGMWREEKYRGEISGVSFDKTFFTNFGVIRGEEGRG